MKSIVLFCEGLWHRAGIERMTVELANLLCHNYNVNIITIDPFDCGKCPYILDRNIRTYSLNSSFGKSLFDLNMQNVKKLRFYLKKLTPEVVITVATPLVRISSVAMIGLGIKNIAWEHFNLNAGSRMGAIYKIISTYLADTTVVLTERDANRFLDLHARNVLSIPNFSTIGENTPSTLESKILLAIGRHEEQKGFDLLLKAWAKTNIPDWKLRIVGNGSQRKSHEELAKELNISNKTEFVDATSHIVEEFKNAGCFVLSSRYEGLVLVLIEAKMMGLPCISFDCPNGPREIIQDKIDGMLVPPENIDILAKTIQKQLSNLQQLKEMGQKAREDALQRYSPNSVLKSWESIINS